MASFASQARVNANPELSDPNQYRRESRRTATIISSFISQLFPLFTAAFGVAILFFPGFGDVLFIGGCFAWLFIQPSKYEFPIDAPCWERHVSIRDDHSLSKMFSEGRLRGRRKLGTASLIIGVEYLRMRILGIDVDKETRHSLVIGSTGSGKTVLIIALLFQVLLQQKTSALVVDGKADIKLFWDIFGLMKRTNRLHNFLVLNFLSGADCLSEEHVHDDDLISHKMNPFNIGTAPQINNLVMGLGRSTEGGDTDFWAGRSSTVLGANLIYLCYKRDVHGIDLDITVIRQSLPLRTMIINAADKEAPAKYTEPLRQYLKTLPGISDELFNMTPEQLAVEEIYQKADEQHIFALLTIQEIMSDLSETMAHIFVTKYSEVNMTDVLMGGRVCLVLLPAIEKSIDSVAALGRLLLAGLRPALAMAAGCQLQGNRLVRVESRPSAAKYPIRLFLDEYGMYGVKGFFVLAALVRSYGIHLLFGAQTAGMFKRAGGQEEYEALMGNMNNKIVLKNEDSEESLKLIQGRTGKIWQAKQERVVATAFGSKHLDDDIRMSETEMLSARLLASPEPGEGLYIFGDQILPFKGLYIQPPKVMNARLNYFAQIRDPYDDEVDRIKARTLLAEPNYVSKINDFVEHELEKLAIPDFSKMLGKVQDSQLVPNDLHQQIIVTLGLLEVAEELDLDSEVESPLDDQGANQENSDDGTTEEHATETILDPDEINSELHAFATDAELQVEELVAEHESFESENAEQPVVHEVVFDDDLHIDFPEELDLPSEENAIELAEPQNKPEGLHFDLSAEEDSIYGYSGQVEYPESESEEGDGETSAASSVYGELAEKFTSQFTATNLDHEALTEIMHEYDISPKIALDHLSQMYTDPNSIDNDQAIDLLKKSFAYPVGDLPEECTEQEVTDTVNSVMSSISGRF